MKVTNYKIKNYPSNVIVFFEYENGTSFGCLDFKKEFGFNHLIYEIEQQILYHIEKNEDEITKKLAREIAQEIKGYIK